jgi:hypothetical protein
MDKEINNSNNKIHQRHNLCQGKLFRHNNNNNNINNNNNNNNNNSRIKTINHVHNKDN